MSLFTGTLGESDGIELQRLAERLEDGPVLAAVPTRLALRPEVVPHKFLFGKLASGDASVRAAAIAALSTLKSEPARSRIAALLNDADAAGLAEMKFGAGKGQPGTVIIVTLGTGIGSAIFHRGQLLPNTEFGHLEFHSKDAEIRLSGAARERRKLGWKAWAREFDEYLGRLELYFGPDVFILGGGVSKEWDRWGKYLTRTTPIKTAQFQNVSGIIGAAYAAGAARQEQLQPPRASTPEADPQVPSVFTGLSD